MHSVYTAKKSICLATAVSAILFSSQLLAQQAPARETVELEEVIVTGSLIKGTPEDAAQPVEVIGEEELANLGRPSNLDLVRSMSEQGGAPGEANRFNGYPVGAATVNLRNLGSRFTTVIFNGRRFPEQYAASVGRFNNINWIPNAAIGRIEVLKQGGAVTYGADAVGGVVNYITKKDLDGFVGNMDYRWIKDSDGDYNADLAWGTKFDNGNFMVVGAYQHRSTLMAIDRPWSQTSFLENKTTANWSAAGSPGAYAFQSLAAPNTYLTYGLSPALPAGFRVGGDRQMSLGGTVRDPNCTVLGGFAGWTATPTPACYQNTAQFENLVEESNQYQLYAELNLTLGDAIDLHTEAMYYQMDLPNLANYPGDSPAGFGGVPNVQGGTGPQQVSGFDVYYVSGLNPAVPGLLAALVNSDGTTMFTPAQIAAINSANGRVVLQTGANLWRPFGNGGNPLVGMQDKQHNNTKMYRLTAELSGDLPELLGTQLEWTTAITYSSVDYKVQANDMLIDRLQSALNGFGGPTCTGTTPGANGCQWFIVDRAKRVYGRVQPQLQRGIRQFTGIN
jgi:iron complex outermembrane recepter protein